jgi:hypothetical protein
MATSAERMRAYRERARRGLRRVTIDVSEGDLQVIAERGYEGAASTEGRPVSDALLLAYDPTWPWRLGITLFGGRRAVAGCDAAGRMVADGSTDAPAMASMVLELAPQ